jgi:hypothetical protein
MSHPSPPPAALPQPAELLQRALESGRIHSAYLFSGPGEAPLESALHFARGLACTGEAVRPCGDCRSCRISLSEAAPIELDVENKHGPFYRHIGDHPDLYWVDRDLDKTRILVSQIRKLQQALRLAANEGGWRAAVIAETESLNLESQNGLLKLLEEPPQRTCLILVSASPAGLLATIRSRCQRVIFSASTQLDLRDPELPEEQRSLVTQLDALPNAGLERLLDWATEYRGTRSEAAEKVQTLLEIGSEWLREAVRGEVAEGGREVGLKLDAFKALATCRRDLIQRNANPQMVAERALIAMRQSIPRTSNAAR